MGDARTVLVTGGHGEIGGAIVRRFEAAGDRVIAPTSAELDLSDPAAIAAWFAREAPAVGALVHCAGLNRPAPFEQIDEALFARTLSVNALAFVDLARRCAPSLRAQRGSVVAVSSLYGFVARRGRLAYVMAKHALVGAVKTLALELGDDGVRVNSVSPGFIDTRMTRQNNSPEVIRGFEQRVPLGRLGRPDEIAEAVYFLSTPAAGFINGHDLVADGGYSIGGFQTP
ncbi:MAG: short-chain dehydrogenase/reductase [Myxococcaceae bacterium]|nr:short-chain dehydrogenase/reductase [Myxococcaceae bacterium]